MPRIGSEPKTINVIEKELTVCKRVMQYKDRVYLYGSLRVDLPKELIGRRVKVYVVWG